jgi:Tfp pilus assembly protein PilO
VVLSQRERYIATATVVVVTVMAVNFLFISPLLAKRAELDTKVTNAHVDRDDAKAVLARRPRDARRWADMAAVLKRGAPESESQLVNSVSSWAQESGMALSSVKPDRPVPEKEFSRITVHLTGTGSMAQVSFFLWRAQTASIPVRVNDLTIAPRKEAVDDFAVTLNLSTIFLTGDVDKLPRPAATAAAANTTNPREAAK